MECKKTKKRLPHLSENNRQKNVSQAAKAFTFMPLTMTDRYVYRMILNHIPAEMDERSGFTQERHHAWKYQESRAIFGHRSSGSCIMLFVNS